ncbi:energy-coupling factor transporter transmembrane protein EcfT [Clostridium sp. D2Q-14]|uniref:energy-coupling factor transporter transmembrane component T family protein n=1 Tax=Anaeromonas gelatinilytica TaxID=2683194 RepID=UPI00193BAB64|nr:energy-coupling factor transporter transmembrane component T [Anaeromonas gelatinilytica]MBS4535525.1 energy-coupling factor transporter transmembrane protein EcfT [Anaeromonas gelatinilytica]
MLKNITIGQYFPGNTIIHKLDPRIKILITLIFIIALFFVDSFTPYLFVIAFIFISIVLSKVPLKYILKGLKPLFIIILITFFINAILTPGKLIFNIGPISITEEGLRQATFMALRLVFLVVGTSLLTLTTSPIALTDGIEKLLNPFRKVGLPAHELAMMMTIALRFIPTLLEETDKIMKAQMARGADFESGNIMNRAKSLVPLLVPLFISAFRRADELAMAMEARCYRGGDNRTRMKVLSLEKRDYLSLGISLLMFAIIIFFRYFI